MVRVKRAEKKTWYLIVAPKLFHNQVVGEILLSSPTKAVGRAVPVNLANLVRDPRRQHITIKLKVTEVAGEKVHTKIEGYQMSPSFIRRMVRKGGNKIDYSFLAETADDQKLRIKTVIIPRRKINLSVASALRKKAEETIKKDFKKIRFAEVMQLIVAYKIQSSMKKQLSKIYPLKSFEIRHVSIEKGKQNEEAKKEEKPKEAKRPAVKEKTKKEAPKAAKEEKPEIKISEKSEDIKKEVLKKEVSAEE